MPARQFVSLVHDSVGIILVIFASIDGAKVEVGCVRVGKGATSESMGS